MAQFFVLGGRDVGRSFDVKPGTILGRSPDCGVRLVDRSVSRHHARVDQEGERWVLVDLGSRNGLRLAGERVERVVLEDHVEILLGDLPLRFRLEAAPLAPAPSRPVPADPPRARAETIASTPLPSPAVPLAAPASPATQRPAPPSAPLGRGEEILLEEEIDLAPDRARPAGRGFEAPAPVTAPASERDLRRTAFLREHARSGFLTSELGQRPVWVQVSVTLFVVALSAGVFWAAFQLVAFLRAT